MTKQFRKNTYTTPQIKSILRYKTFFCQVVGVSKFFSLRTSETLVMTQSLDENNNNMLLFSKRGLNVIEKLQTFCK